MSAGPFRMRLHKFVLLHVAAFAYSENDPKPPPLKESPIGIIKLGFTAEEMHSFMRHFALIVGHLVPRNDAFWHLYLTIKK